MRILSIAVVKQICVTTRSEVSNLNSFLFLRQKQQRQQNQQRQQQQQRQHPNQQQLLLLQQQLLLLQLKVCIVLSIVLSHK